MAKNNGLQIRICSAIAKSALSTKEIDWFTIEVLEGLNIFEKIGDAMNMNNFVIASLARTELEPSDRESLRTAIMNEINGEGSDLVPVVGVNHETPTN